MSRSQEASNTVLEREKERFERLEHEHFERIDEEELLDATKKRYGTAQKENRSLGYHSFSAADSESEGG